MEERNRYTVNSPIRAAALIRGRFLNSSLDKANIGGAALIRGFLVFKVNSLQMRSEIYKKKWNPFLKYSFLFFDILSHLNTKYVIKISNNNNKKRSSCIKWMSKVGGCCHNLTRPKAKSGSAALIGGFPVFKCPEKIACWEVKSGGAAPIGVRLLLENLRYYPNTLTS